IRSVTMPTRRSATAARIRRPICTPGPKSAPGSHALPRTGWRSTPVLPSQLADVIALARAVPQATIVMCHVGGVLGYGAYAGKKDEVHAAWRGRSPRRVASQHGGVGHVPERLRQTRRHAEPLLRIS